MTIFTEPEANNCFNIYNFRAKQQRITDQNVKTEVQFFVCIHQCSRIVLLLSLHLHRLWIRCGSKTSKQNTTKNKFIRYLCFFAVDFIHSYHHCLNMISSFSLEKSRFRWSDLLMINITASFLILNWLEQEFLN